jgi:AbrB family looped-hinge helix DNA binding protein
MGKEAMTTTLTSKGRVTIPQPIRQRLGLKIGDRVDFVLDSNGSVVLKTRKLPFELLRGIAKTGRRKPVTVAEMNKAIADAAADRFLRATSRRRPVK